MQGLIDPHLTVEDCEDIARAFLTLAVGYEELAEVLKEKAHQDHGYLRHFANARRGAAHRYLKRANDEGRRRA